MRQAFRFIPISILLLSFGCEATKQALRSDDSRRPTEEGEGVAEYLVPAGEGREFDYGTARITVAEGTADKTIRIKLRRIGSPEAEVDSLILQSALSDVLDVELVDVDNNAIIASTDIKIPVTIQHSLRTELTEDKIDFVLHDKTDLSSVSKYIIPSNYREIIPLDPSDVSLLEAGSTFAIATSTKIPSFRFYLVASSDRSDDVTIATKAQVHTVPTGNTTGTGAGTTTGTTEETEEEVPAWSAHSLVAAGGAHSCVVTADGEVKAPGDVLCWGDNTEGALGTGTLTLSHCSSGGSTCGTSLPKATLPNGEKAKAVVAGTFHSCSLTVSGEVYCWGNNSYGQLGVGDLDSRCNAFQTGICGESLTKVAMPGGESAMQITAGGYHTCALLQSGKVVCWGW